MPQAEIFYCAVRFFLETAYRVDSSSSKRSQKPIQIELSVFIQIFFFFKYRTTPSPIKVGLLCEERTM